MSFACSVSFASVTCASIYMLYACYALCVAHSSAVQLGPDKVASREASAFAAVHERPSLCRACKHKHTTTKYMSAYYKQFMQSMQED